MTQGHAHLHAVCNEDTVVASEEFVSIDGSRPGLRVCFWVQLDRTWRWSANRVGVEGHLPTTLNFEMKFAVHGLIRSSCTQKILDGAASGPSIDVRFDEIGL